MIPEVVNGWFVVVAAIVGAILTGGISWIQSSRNRSRSELTIFTGRPEVLIEVDSSITEIVEVRVRGEPVPSVFTLDTRIVNTGTETLNSGDIHVNLGEDGKIVAVDIADSSDGVRSSLKLSGIKEGKSFSLHFEYINPGEEFMVRALLSADTGKVIPSFRQPGVKTIVRDRMLEETTNAILEVAFPILGFRPFLLLLLGNKLVERRSRSHQRKLDRGEPSS